MELGQVGVLDSNEVELGLAGGHLSFVVGRAFNALKPAASAPASELAASLSQAGCRNQQQRSESGDGAQGAALHLSLL